jgi:hypothetical protein
MQEQMPPEGAPPAEGGGGDAASQVGELVNNVNTGLTMLAELMDKIPDTAPEDKEAMGGLIEGFQALMMKMAGGAGGEAPAPQGGGKSKAVPMQSVQGKPMSPAGM